MNHRLLAGVLVPLALAGFARADEDRAVRAAIDSLQSPDWGARRAAVRALVGAGLAAVPALTRALKSPRPHVRVGAAEALWRVDRQTKAALPVLLAALEDKDEQVCRAAVAASWEIGTDAREAAPALRKLTKGGSPQVRVHAAYALWKVGRPPEEVLPVFRQALLDRDEGALEDACGLLSLMREAARGITPTLLELAERGDDNKRHKAVILLGDVGADPKVAVPALRKALKDKYYLTRGNASVALGKMGGPTARAALPELRAMLKDDHGVVRAQAAGAVWALGRDAKGVVPALIAELSNRKDFLADIAAAGVLGRIGPDAKAAVPALRRMLADESEARRNAARDALRSIDPKALAEQKKP